MAENGLCRRLPGASPALCALLDASRGSILAPIRAEIFGVQRFCQHARSLGQTHRAQSMPLWAATFFPHLKSNMVVLREAHKYIGLQASTGYDISPAAEWLLDNFHTIEAQLKEIHDGLPRSYFRSLPMLMDAPLAGLPRIYGIAWAFVAHTDGAFDEELLVQFLMAYQETRELNLSEIWALPTTLRVVLVENLRRLAERVATSKAAREVANLCFDRIESYDIDALNHVLALLTQRGVGQVFLTQMTQRLQDRRVSGDDISQLSVQDWLRTSLPELGSMQSQQGADQAADNLSVSNAVSSLRAVGDANWPDIVARTSSLMRLMLTSHLFAAEDAATQDQTLHAIERLSKRSRLSEVVVATTLLDLMQPSEASASETTVAHHWLRGKGLPALLVRLNVRPQWGLSGSGWTARLVLPTYLGLLLGTLSLIVWWLMLRPAAPFADSPYPWLHGVALLALVFPVSEALVAVLNRLISESARPRRLPRLAFADGIPPEHRVIVVIPGMLTSAASVADLAHRLELHYLANPEPQAQFALLTDWADAPTVRLPGDAPLLAAAQRHIDALNAQHPVASNLSNDPPRFIVLHRERVFSNSEQCWIGWERKRGKLERLIEALATGVQTAFIDLGPASRLAGGAQYVVTLDSDTQLPPGRLRELVGVAAHPHNQPAFRRQSVGTVVSGYGILQPRIVLTPAAAAPTGSHPSTGCLPANAAPTPTARPAPRSTRICSPKAASPARACCMCRPCTPCCWGRLPERQRAQPRPAGRVARALCAVSPTSRLIEDAPFHADVAASRVHRWTRGDWQLLPFLYHPVRSCSPFARGINRWKMFDNLRRSLVAPDLAGDCCCCWRWQGWGSSPLMALALVFAAFSAGPLMGALAGFSPAAPTLPRRHFYARPVKELAARRCGAGCGTWRSWREQALLAHGRDCCAACIAPWASAGATCCSGPRLQPRPKPRRGSWAVLLDVRRLPPHGALLAAALLLAVLLALDTPAMRMGAGRVVLLVWAGSPLWNWWVSRALPGLRRCHAWRCRSAERATWRACCARHLAFFRAMRGARRTATCRPTTCRLHAPHDMVAHRTSPTNIGLYLLSVGLRAPVRLDRHTRPAGPARSHLNHLGTSAAPPRPLPELVRHPNRRTAAAPAYVSTVDSGNLCGHLLAVAQACRELAACTLR
jgi:cyclic beta-1,2-glucan synthetase